MCIRDRPKDGLTAESARQYQGQSGLYKITSINHECPSISLPCLRLDTTRNEGNVTPQILWVYQVPTGEMYEGPYVSNYLHNGRLTCP